MRTVFVKYLVDAAQSDESIYLMSGDLGFGVFEPFREKFPQRFINAGISEQNMIGVAAGLAMAGKTVFVYSIIPFVTMRCFEQVRNDICYQGLPVKLVGVGGGLSYGSFGLTHHALEDVAIMRVLSGMSIIVPGSKYETQELMPQFHRILGPAYLRLSNNEELVQYQPNTNVVLGNVLEIIPNDEHMILASGNALDLGYNVCKKLEQGGISYGLASVHTIKPFDVEYIVQKSKTLKSVVTIEEHSIIGGLGDVVARALCEKVDKKIDFTSCGVNDFYFHEAGSRKDLLEKAELTVDKVTHVIMKNRLMF